MFLNVACFVSLMLYFMCLLLVYCCFILSTNDLRHLELPCSEMCAMQINLAS